MLSAGGLGAPFNGAPSIQGDHLLDLCLFKAHFHCLVGSFQRDSRMRLLQQQMLPLLSPLLLLLFLRFTLDLFPYGLSMTSH